MKIATLLPFMEGEDIKELAQKIINKEVKGVKLVILFPFLNTEDLDEICDLLIKEGNNRDLYSALPFLGKEKINKLYEEVKAGNLEGFKENALIPFIGHEKIKEIFNTLVKEAEENVEE